MTALPESLLTGNQKFLIYSFLRKSTECFDDSHNHVHAHNVYVNTMIIIDKLGIEYEEDIVFLASKLHDVCDHKYIGRGGITIEELVSFIEKMVGEVKATRIMSIIDNISFSKEISGKRKTLDFCDDFYLQIISDADRLEAIGEVGLERCITFTKERGGKVPEDVVQHCKDKLLRLSTEFIRTLPGKEMAAPLHKVIQDYVDQNKVDSIDQ
ncbi:MAG: hypothetical protein PHG66_01080 [Candidatus Colwellbacteria bacterium]|nr:hypothetical protein [Candidatus Colwellbacteria bacterium]